jgi:hypothetical protein
MMGFFSAGLCALAILLLATAPPSRVQDQKQEQKKENVRGATTGPTSAPGYSHPDQFAHLKTVKPAENMYGVIQHPDQDKAAAQKLADTGAAWNEPLAVTD